MLFLTLKIRLLGAFTVDSVTMLPFDGEGAGAYFRGKILPGGVDTQTTDEEGVTHLSAKYMLEGEDYTGQPCRLFVDNEGIAGEPLTHPTIVTNSAALKCWERKELFGKLSFADGGVIVELFSKEEKE